MMIFENIITKLNIYYASILFPSVKLLLIIEVFFSINREVKYITNGLPVVCHGSMRIYIFGNKCILYT